MGVNILKIGRVESLYSPYGDGRIKVRIPNDNHNDIGEEDYAFPLLPKTLQSIPKVGESVLVVLAQSENSSSNRFYLGPIISQPQDMEESPYSNAIGQSLASFKGSVTKLHQALRYKAETDGAFPKESDVAVVGRYGEDVILRENEMELRVGARVRRATSNENSEDDIEGKRVWFNMEDPTFIQLRHQNGLNTNTDKAHDGNGVINLVADKINIISYKEKEKYDVTLPNQNDMLAIEDLDKVMDKLYRLPYGEILVKALVIIKNAIMNHWHAYPYMYPTVNGVAAMEALYSENFSDLLSNHVRIS